MGLFRRIREDIEREAEIYQEPACARGCMNAVAAAEAVVRLEQITTERMSPAREEIARKKASAVLDNLNRQQTEENPDCSARLYLEEDGRILLRCAGVDCPLLRSDV